MNTIRIAPSQSVTRSQSDLPAGAPETDSDTGFGAILQAQSGSPRSAQRQDRRSEPSQDAATDSAERAQARRNKASKAGAQRTAERGAAAAAADPAASTSGSASAPSGTVGAGRTTAHAVDASGTSGAAGAAVASTAPLEPSSTAAALDGAATASPLLSNTGAGAGPAASARAVALTPDPGAVAPDAKSPDGAAAAVTAQIELTRSQPSDATAPADAGAASNASGGASDPTAAVALARRLANGTQRADSKIPGEADPTSGQTTDTTGDATGSDKNANFAASLLASVAPTAGNSAQAGALEAAGSRPIDASAPPAGGAAAALPETTGASVTGAFGPAPTYAAEVRASVATPVGHPAFGQDLSQQVVLLTRRGVQSAQISLDPAGLGPVSVSIQVHGHAASLAFTAAHEATRHALEAALPRLREMFASSGMQLSDATVGGRSQQEWTASGRPQTSSWANPEASLAPSSDAAATPRGAAVRLVDTYA